MTCNAREVILEMIDDIFDLSQNLLCLVELGVQNTYLLIDSQEVSDAVIFQPRQFLFDLFSVSSYIQILLWGDYVWQEIVVLLLLLHI